jgi:CRP/FNR family transcriptional regulator, cyclic AMP receptor protein
MSDVESHEALYGLLGRAGEPQSFAAGDVVFNQGDHGDVMYVVIAGSVQLRDGDRVLDTIEAPGLFGEMALIEHKPRSLGAVAGEDTQLVEIPTRAFWVLVHETPYFARLVMRVMAERLRRANAIT